MNTAFLLTALLGAAAAAYLLYAAGEALRTYRARKASLSGLDAFVSPAAPAPAEQQFHRAARPGSEAFKIRLAFGSLGLDAAGREQEYRAYASLLVGFIAGLLLLALFRALPYALAGGAAAGFLLTEVWIAAAWGRMKTEINADLPLYFRNLAGMLKVNTNVVNAMDAAAQVLDEERPLYRWVQYAVREAQRGPHALADLVHEAYAVSPALGMMTFQIRRYAETGGSGYTEGFRLAADGIAEMLDIKRLGLAQARRAYNLMYMFIGLSAFSLGVMMWNPVGRAMFLGTRMGRLALLGVFVIALAGYFAIRETIQEAVE